MTYTRCHATVHSVSDRSTLRQLESGENVREKTLGKWITLQIGRFGKSGELPDSLRLHGKRVPAFTGMEELKERLPGAHQEVHRRRKHIPLLFHLARGQAGRGQLSQVAAGTQP